MFDLIIERLPDWNYGAFLDEESASCIAIGTTAEEAREKAMYILIATYRKVTNANTV